MQTTDHAILIRYDEVALKGGNRGWFEKKLVINLKRMLRSNLGPDAIIETERQRGRILIRTNWNDQARDAVERTFGVSSFSPMSIVPTTKDAITAKAVELFKSHCERYGKPASFRVRSRRSDKALPETSVELDRWFGGAILRANEGIPLKVDLENAELTVGVEIRREHSFVWTENVPGPRGLPTGTNSRVMTLLSGGLDSPVAAVQVMKRGAPTDFVHFYGTPFVGEEVLMKVEDLARQVRRWSPQRQVLYVVPFGKLQEKIALETDPKLRTLLYRRMMVRIACGLAEKNGALALVTGEALGQVASQTVENMGAVDSVSTLPILRPLVTYDKDEIVRIARRIGTYDISIRPGMDCCTLFADRHPVIRAQREVLERQEERFPLEELVREGIEGTFTREI